MYSATKWYQMKAKLSTFFLRGSDKTASLEGECTVATESSSALPYAGVLSGHMPASAATIIVAEHLAA